MKKLSKPIEDGDHGFISFEDMAVYRILAAVENALATMSETWETLAREEGSFSEHDKGRIEGMATAVEMVHAAKERYIK